ncbi:hypothetical protein M2132_000972 [Dysgonomonas sp. PH5-45]|uniref:DUF3943 domain-containing protein n=1 Tax=unclassified Dysgonomonas TaxID=2630389 RepID=UPI002475B065|nr:MULTISPECIES: DUF3943 domain-containing protein [unclassified Dysgonomonas]MDH6354644.1 hypothetical protein [Dysgonomonas sp. PH5-45]MDH6387542.1 hypothetical protein [Dysgonomonas sp. PH5-37]
MLPRSYIVRLSLLILLFVSFTAPVCAQFTMRKLVVPHVEPDSADWRHYRHRKHHWRAAGLVVGLNLGVWGFDRYILNEDFARISGKTIRRNFKHGFVWDNDQMGTNLFLHPYHGNLYYNAARSNGVSFWGSGGYAFMGSFMWEMFMENEYPSINDIIVTPIGGTVLGEVAFRSTDMILDDRASGRERWGREIAAFIVAPTRGLTRLITGDAWKKRRTSGRQFGIPKLSVELSGGVRLLELRDDIFDEGAGFSTLFSVEYGDRYEADGQKPFDYFVFRGNLNVQSSQPLLGQINVMARLWGKDLVDDKNDYFGMGIYQHFDYYDSDTISDESGKIPYKFATPASFGFGLMHKSKRFSDWDFNSYAHFNGIIIGASLSDHYQVDNRNYNLCSGFGWKTGVSISYKDKIGVSWWHENFRMFTWKGYPEGYDLSRIEDPKEVNFQGDKSVATLNASNLRVDMRLKDRLYLTGMYTLYRRSTRYAYMPDVKSWSSDGKILLTYKF